MSQPKNKKVSESTRELINLALFEENGIATLQGRHLVFLEVQPFNVAVLGKVSVLDKISKLQSILTAVGNMEILCLSSSQSYEKNKAYLKSRSEDMSMNLAIREICQLEMEYLDNISLTMSTSRAFYFVLPFKKLEKDLIQQKVSQYTQVISEQGFTIKIATKQDLQKALAIYWEQNTHMEYYPDFDGEQYILEESNG